ncbi:hypothetical protein [Chryseobacterium luquanense]|uniref:Uncharacterized protein n=1 Tax=Chryseobacterium luquanense TaxID=2983766 RepID=A0ABT3Y0A1_9FLAO|nr:hypothetical protein [Chryseobacterium luquanense]MCX8531573.1 hypothetical protein [Chryseobacterium luquanense]
MAEQQDSIGVRRARLDSLKIYEISEKELDLLEKGSGDSMILNCSISLFSIFLSFFTVLLTVDFFYDDKDDLIVKFLIFLCLTIICFLGSLVCFIIWFKNRGDFKKTVTEIKNRMDPERLPSTDEDAIEIRD